jgi:hypothetical protein
MSLNPTIYTAGTGKGYYVSAVDAGNYWLLSGPYDSHAAAIADVDDVQEIAIKNNPFAHFYSFGTCLAQSRNPGRCQVAGVFAIKQEETHARVN